MKLALWEDFKKIALYGSPDKPQKVPVALIVDSPWLPGFMGIPNREVLPDGTLEEVRIYAAKCIRKTEGKGEPILPAGGGVPPGVPAENIDALVQASRIA